MIYEYKVQLSASETSPGQTQAVRKKMIPARSIGVIHVFDKSCQIKSIDSIDCRFVHALGCVSCA